MLAKTANARIMVYEQLLATPAMNLQQEHNAALCSALKLKRVSAE